MEGILEGHGVILLQRWCLENGSFRAHRVAGNSNVDRMELATQRETKSQRQNATLSSF